jgi:hypothetical protein
MTPEQSTVAHISQVSEADCAKKKQVRRLIVPLEHRQGLGIFVSMSSRPGGH